MLVSMLWSQVAAVVVEHCFLEMLYLVVVALAVTVLLFLVRIQAVDNLPKQVFC
jgi:hypothetical protein